MGRKCRSVSGIPGIWRLTGNASEQICGFGQRRLRETVGKAWQNMYDVAIVGAGIVGGMLARALSAFDLKVCVLEKENDVAMGATHANSGIVHAGYDAPEGSLKARLNVRGSQMMETVAGELGVPYRRNGSLVIGFGEEDRQAIETLYARGVKNGVKELRILEGAQARELEPALSERVTCALHAPTGAIICPYELAIAAMGNAMDNGVDLLLNFEVRQIDRKQGYYEIFSGSVKEECREVFSGAEKAADSLDIVLDAQKKAESSQTGFSGVQEIAELGQTGFSDEKTTKGRQDASSDARMVRARYVVNAAGVHADEIAKLVGDASIQIHPRRGEYLLLDRECGSLVSSTVFRTPSRKGKGILVTPTVDGNLLLGPTSVDMEDKEDHAVTEEGIARIMERAQESIRDIPLRKVITSFCGLRAVGNTGDFILNSPFPGFFNAAGIESPGLSASPAIAEYLVEMLAGQGLELRRKEAYQPLRKPVYAFRHASLEEKNRMIQEDSAFGRVVCRCETVTEGEIIAAIRSNPPARDLDGVKRRTRAQMGRCQGGFCMPYIMEILARELGIGYEEVVKSGKGSEIAVCRTKESRGNAVRPS